MSDNRTTELLRELRDLACDIHASEIIDHVSITRMGWTFDAQWLDSWHAEFDRITDKLEQAVAATLGSGTCENANTNGYCFRFECSGCGYSTIVHNCAARLDELPNFCPNCGGRVIPCDHS